MQLVDPLNRLIEVTRSITGVLDQEELLQLIIDSAVEVTGAERGYLILLDPDEGLSLEDRMRVGAACRLDPEEMARENFRASRTAIMKVLASRTGQNWDDALAEPNPSQSMEMFGLRSILCEPLVIHERILGLLYLDSKITRRFTDGHREILPSFASQASICIENAVLLTERAEATRREHAEQVRAREMEAYRDAMSAFMAIASHDLKGPLAVVQGGLGVLKRLGWDNPTASEVIEDMELAVKRANRLVATYLDATALQEGKQLRLEVRPVALRPLAQKELDFVAASVPEDEREKYRFENDVQPDLRAVADPERLQQILGNLLQNAVKYSPAGGRVSVRGWKEQGLVHLAVSDEGPGISPQDRERLFHRYVRVDPDSTSRGSGLGLWIVRCLVEAHGGTVEVLSHPGRGSEFRCTLPAA